MKTALRKKAPYESDLMYVWDGKPEENSCGFIYKKFEDEQRFRVMCVVYFRHENNRGWTVDLGMGLTGNYLTTCLPRGIFERVEVHDWAELL